MAKGSAGERMSEANIGKKVEKWKTRPSMELCNRQITEIADTEILPAVVKN